MPLSRPRLSNLVALAATATPPLAPPSVRGENKTRGTIARRALAPPPQRGEGWGVVAFEVPTPKHGQAPTCLASPPWMPRA